MATQPSNAVLESPLPGEVLHHLYETMLQARLLSSRFRGVNPMGEAVLAGALENADGMDTVVSAEMNPVLEILRGAEIASVSRPKITNGESQAERKTISAGITNVPGIALGLAIGLKRAQMSSVIFVMIPGKQVRGEGWMRALEFGGSNRLPVLFVVDSSGLRDSRQDRNCSEWPCPRISVDARDVIAVYRVTKEAAAAARRGYGPTLIECIDFVAPGTRGKDRRDPLTSFRGYLKRHDAWSEEWATSLENRIKQQIGSRSPKS